MHSPADPRLRPVGVVEDGDIKTLSIVFHLDGDPVGLDGVPQRDPWRIGVENHVRVRFRHRHAHVKRLGLREPGRKRSHPKQRAGQTDVARLGR